jgi:hypothetical protein
VSVNHCCPDLRNSSLFIRLVSEISLSSEFTDLEDASDHIKYMAAKIITTQVAAISAFILMVRPS